MAKHRVLGFVHEEGVWNGRAKRLEASIIRAYRNHIDPDAKVQIVWGHMPTGQSYLAGYPSTASTLSAPVPDGTDQQVRERFMLEICESWMSETGCDVNEIICNAADVSLIEQLSQANFDRYAPSERKKRMQRMALGTLWKKLTKGHFSFSTDMKR